MPLTNVVVSLFPEVSTIESTITYLFKMIEVFKQKKKKNSIFT